VQSCEVVAKTLSWVICDGRSAEMRDETIQEYEQALAPTLQRNTLMLAICEIRGWYTLKHTMIEWGQPSRYQGVSLPHATT